MFHEMPPKSRRKTVDGVTISSREGVLPAGAHGCWVLLRASRQKTGSSYQAGLGSNTG